jgi:hypothetical protein
VLGNQMFCKSTQVSWQLRVPPLLYRCGGTWGNPLGGEGALW